MAIEAYVGLPGHGKSYGVVEHVVMPSLREGRHVVTNIPLERDDLLADCAAPGAQITQLPDDWFERPDMADFAPAGCVLVLDELWRRWPAGLKSNNALLADKSLLAEHRHRVDAGGQSMRIVLVTQDLAQVASWVRLLVEQTYRMTKLTSIGANKRFRVDIYAGAPTGANPPRSKLIRSTYGRYRPQVYRYYSSATQSATGQVGDESTADGRGLIWRSPVIIFSIVGPLIGLPLLLWWLVGYFGSGMGMVDAPAPAPVAQVVNPLPASVQPVRVVSAPVSAPAVVQPAGQPQSTSWRVAGSMLRAVPGEGMADVVILRSPLLGQRLVLATECERLPNGIDWACDVDGQRVTPWTGRGDSTHWASDPGRLVSRTAAVASGASNGGGTTSGPVNPLPAL